MDITALRVRVAAAQGAVAKFHATPTPTKYTPQTKGKAYAADMRFAHGWAARVVAGAEFGTVPVVAHDLQKRGVRVKTIVLRDFDEAGTAAGAAAQDEAALDFDLWFDLCFDFLFWI